MDLSFVYIFLNLLVFGIFCLAGYNISHRGNYIKNSVVCVLSFALLQGLRYMRGNDYLRYIHTFLYDDDPEQRFFTLINQLLRSIGVGRYYYLIIYAAIFMICALYFLKSYRVYAKYSFPLCLIAYISFNEYVVRQALAYSFIFLFLYELRTLWGYIDYKGQKKLVYSHLLKLVLWVILAYSTHTVSLVTISVIVLISFMPFAIPWYWAAFCYIVVAYYAQSFFNWEILNPLMDAVANNGDDLAAKYANASSTWFGGNTNEEWARNPIIKSMETIGHCVLFYLMNKIILRNQKGRDIILYYNTFIIGSILLQLFFMNELLRRVSEPFHFFWFLVLSIVLCSYSIFKFRWERMSYLALLFWCWDYFHYIFMRGENTKFIWDM